jgi:fibronectin-binding autotransporter adhesin
MSLTIQDNATVSSGVNNFNLHNSTAASSTTAINLNGGTLSVGGFTKSQIGAGQTSTINFNGGLLKASANNATFLNALSGLTANISAGGAKMDDGGFAITITQPLLHDAALGAAPDGGLAKFGAGTLTLSGVNTYKGATLINAGVLALQNGGAAATIGNSTSINVAAGAQFDVTGVPGGLSLAFGQSLTGNGSINGNVAVSHGLLIPGSNSIGTLTFSNSLMLAGGGTNIFEIGKSPLTNDAAKIFGALTNGGTLIVSKLDATALAAGDTFKLFDAASYSGSFASVQLPSLPAGLAWNTNALNSGGTISVVLNTMPFINAIYLSGNGLALSGTGGVGNADYFLLSATNLATPLSNWTRLLTNQFDNSGKFNFTNAVSPDAPQKFYLLQLP